MRRRLLGVMAVLTAGLAATVVLALSVGTIRIGWLQTMAILGANVLPLPVFWTEAQETIVLTLRLPRVLLAAIVGSALSLAGAGFQAISRNPLADPGVLGVSSG
ncbi:MAG: iron chelate uptake ABC transporter family permease subunit, partial [Candidatus Methylomirabilales bacterium]